MAVNIPTPRSGLGYLEKIKAEKSSFPLASFCKMASKVASVVAPYGALG